MLWFWWNLVFICKIGQENWFCQYFCTFFSISRENRDFLLKKMIFFNKKSVFSRISRISFLVQFYIWIPNFIKIQALIKNFIFFGGPPLKISSQSIVIFIIFSTAAVVVFEILLRELPLFNITIWNLISWAPER